MLGDPNGESFRFKSLRRFTSSIFPEYVVRILWLLWTRENGELTRVFRASIDRLVRGLSVFP